MKKIPLLILLSLPSLTLPSYSNTFPSPLPQSPKTIEDPYALIDPIVDIVMVRKLFEDTQRTMTNIRKARIQIENQLSSNQMTPTIYSSLMNNINQASQAFDTLKTKYNQFIQNTKYNPKAPPADNANAQAELIALSKQISNLYKTIYNTASQSGLSLSIPQPQS